MPSISNAKLTLDPAGTDIKIEVTYDVSFTRLESNLAGLGMTFTELVQIIGVDPPGSTNGIVLHTIGVGEITVPLINQSQVLNRVYRRTVRRASLDEDRDLLRLDEDEIRGRIRILGQGLQTRPNDEFTNQVVLSVVGDIRP